MTTGLVAELARFPVKSMAGERLSRAEFGPLGIAGDRHWAVYTEDGGIGSGKTTRRFRRIAGLFDLQARLAVPAAAGEDVPTVRFPDGLEYRADDPAAETALSVLLGRPVRLRQESSVVHHDESRVHVITTVSLRHLGRLIGEPIAAARFRANVVLAVDGDGVDDGFVEDAWTGRTLALGDEVRLALGTGMPRCVMVGLPQPRADLPVEPHLLKQLGQVHDLRFGLKAEVVRGGTVRTGDLAALL